LRINVWELVRLANLHPRVNILQPGPGVGGHCIAVDPWFIVDAARDQANLIRTAREVNDSKPHFVVERVRHAASRLRDPVIGCLGLSFKANIDDLRESPAVDIVRHLIEGDIGDVLVMEPHIDELPPGLHGAELVTTSSGLERADIVVLLVDHAQFSSIDTDRLQAKVVIDTRGLWSSRRGLQ
jgi:UDP-N-acetyl-D-mannosaminuronic acid dehydrogenase